MSVRMRHTRGHTGNRRSHHALSAINSLKDKESGNLRLPHHMDENTGMYRGKQIAPARPVGMKKVKASTKVKGPSTEPVVEHVHEHAHTEHTNAEVKSSKGIFGKIATAGRPKARSGFGGGA